MKLDTFVNKIKVIDTTDYDMDLYSDIDDEEGFGGRDQIFIEDNLLYVHVKIVNDVVKMLERVKWS